MADVADTAVAIARIRAEEALLPAPERLFGDPYAALFSHAEESGEVTARLLSVPFLRESVRLRTRFIDDVVRGALAEGARQVVLLGVGFDCRALRLPEIAAAGARVFEVDFSAQLARKAAILGEAGVPTPAWVTSVACDFTASDLDQALPAALVADGFARDHATAFVWEGVTGYLDDDAIDRTLRLIAALAAPGTSLVFNYQIHRFGPEELRARVRAAGFASVEAVELAALHRRWLGTEPPAVSDLFRIAVARR